MLAITAKVRLLKEEVFSAKSLFKDIIGSLKGLDSNSNYYEKIGIFCRQKPEWKILSKERDLYVSALRQVCTGEASPEDATEFFEHALKEIEKIDTWLQVPKK
ncbi:MAG: hypothetical protein E7310_03475 [Clostridiales bacterium]|nr:hypothetical protein [Clostridiales bacterium]